MKPGRSRYEWHAGAEFFEKFENSEVLDADLKVDADFWFDDYSAGVKCSIEGTVTVTCDRCLEDLILPVSTEFELEDDELDLSHDLDLSQDVYDFTIISLPLQRTHPDGECNEETTKYLSK